MPGLIFIPFAVFMACTIGQFAALRRMRQALVDRHPQIWLEQSRNAWFPNSTGMGFALRRGDRALGDPELSRSVDMLMLCWAVAIGAWVVMMGLMISTAGVAHH